VTIGCRGVFHNLPEEVSPSCGGLDHVVGSLYLSGVQAQDDCVDDSVQMVLHG